MVHTTAALTAAGWLLAGASVHDAIITAIAVLIITCPCALALAIPAVQVVASGALFRSRVIVNAGDADRAPGRGRHGHLRQDRNADAARAAGRGCRRFRSGHAREGGTAGTVEPSSPGGGGGARGARAHAVRGRGRGAGAGGSCHDRWQRGAARQPGLLRCGRGRRARAACGPQPRSSLSLTRVDRACSRFVRSCAPTPLP